MQIDPSLVDQAAEPERVALRFYPALRLLSARLEAADDGAGPFHPSLMLPELDESLARLLEPTRICWRELETRCGTPVAVLDLGADPATHTTKSIASYLMVLRAVVHIRSTGERVWLVTPSSANKATALRAAVERAITLGLVEADRLGVASLVPSASLGKLRAGVLCDEPALAARNPVFVWPGEPKQAVKEVAEAVVRERAADMLERKNIRLWYTLDLRNYRMADIVRALFMATHDGFSSAPAVTHAHAVSSGYGLLGYAWGHQLLERFDLRLPTPRFFLVQHLARPDLVQYWRHGRFAPLDVAAYTQRSSTGELEQDVIAELPFRTWSIDESIDSTFYTAQPSTAPELVGHMRRHGGGAVVVSLRECYQRYGAVRAWLAGSGISLPADPRELREHALLMAATGVLNGLERGLLTVGEPVLIHNSGSYAVGDFRPLSGAALRNPAGTHAADLAQSVARWLDELE